MNECSFESSNMIIIGEKEGCQVAMEIAAKYECALFTCINFDLQKLDHADKGSDCTPKVEDDDLVRINKINYPILLICGGEAKDSCTQKSQQLRKYAKGKKIKIQFIKGKAGSILHPESDIQSPILQYSKENTSLNLGPSTETPKDIPERPLLTSDQLGSPSKYYKLGYLYKKYDFKYNKSLCCCVIM